MQKIRHSDRPRANSFWIAVVGAVALVIGSAGLGIVVNHFSPQGIPLLLQTSDDALAVTPQLPPGMLLVSLEEARSAWSKETALFVDARPHDLYMDGHIPGAVNLPAYEFDDQLATVADSLEQASMIVVYCDGWECSDSIDVAERLIEYGFQEVRVFERGWRAWHTSGAPIMEGLNP